jgi:hypothetical protein
MANLITVVTRFQLPAGVTADQIRAAFDEAAPRFRNVPGLVRKQFLRSKDCRTAGGVYLWNDERAAREHPEPEAHPGRQSASGFFLPRQRKLANSQALGPIEAYYKSAQRDCEASPPQKAPPMWGSESYGGVRTLWRSQAAGVLV